MDLILAVNKPKNMTSFDVVSQIRKKYRVKVGHMGTLDPQATGLLVILVGKMTKYLQFLQAEPKQYHAQIQLGLRSDSGDIWGKVLEKSDLIILEKSQIQAVLASFIGKQKQRVPMVSAKKVAGKKLYQYHRQAIEVETQYHDIEIYQLEFINYDAESGQIEFMAMVSTGTYIRTLCEDIAEKLGTIGTMSSLKRTLVGPYRIEQAGSLEDVLENDQAYRLDAKEALSHFETYEIEDALPVYQGKPLLIDSLEDRILVMYNNEPLAVYKRLEANKFITERGLW